MARRAKVMTEQVSESADSLPVGLETTDSVPVDPGEVVAAAPPAPVIPMPMPTSPSDVTSLPLPVTNGNGHNGRKGLFSRMYGDVGAAKAEDRERVAAAEWQAVVSPVMDLLQASVPDASSADEAAQAWNSGGPVTPDPEGGAYIYGDAFDTDARVYYRLLRRDYEKDPRPGVGDAQSYYMYNLAKKSNKSHYLPAPYGQRPGIKGW